MKFPEKLEIGTKNLLKMKASESVIGVFRGEIRTFRQHWEANGASKRPTVCDEVSCARCAAGVKAVFRFQLNFVVKENAVMTAKVFEGGFKTMKQLEELNKDYPLERNMVKVTRTGSGTDTTYSFLPTKNSNLTKEQEVAVSRVELNDLDPSVSAAAGAQSALSATDGPEAQESEDIPF